MPIHAPSSASARPVSTELAPRISHGAPSLTDQAGASTGVRFASVDSTPARRARLLTSSQAPAPAAVRRDLLDRIESSGAPDAQDARQFMADVGAKAYRSLDNRLGTDLSELPDRHAQALKAGVNVAKRSFYQRLGGALTVALAATGLVFAGVATGGTLLLAGGIVAAATGLRMGADAACARMAVTNAQCQARGEPPKYQLPMGSDALGNLFYRLTPSTWTPEQREDQARRLVLALDTLVAVGSCVSSAGLSGLLVAVPTLMVMGLKQAFEDEIRTKPTLEEMLATDGDNGQAADQIGEQMLELGADIDQLRQALGKPEPGTDEAELKKALALKEKRLDALVDRISHVLEAPGLEAARSSPSRWQVGKGMASTVLGMGLLEGQGHVDDRLQVPVLGETLALVEVGLLAREMTRRDTDMSDMKWLQGQAPEELQGLKQRHQALSPRFEMVIEERHPPSAFV